MKIKIPFKKEFREVLINGRKVVTSRTKEHFLGACGKRLSTFCYPDFEDDLCVGCDFNGWEEEEREIEELEEEMAEEEDLELKYENE